MQQRKIVLKFNKMYVSQIPDILYKSYFKNILIMNCTLIIEINEIKTVFI